MPFTFLPPDVNLAEYAQPFPTAVQVAEFLLDLENDTEAFIVLRSYVLEYSYLHHLEGTNWQEILAEMRRYSDLPFDSLTMHGLCAVFAAASDLLRHQ